MKKMFKKVVATALAAVMALGAFIAVNPSEAKADGEYTAVLGAQMDSSFNAEIGEWPDLAASSTKFTEGTEATLTYTFASKVKFAGNYVAVDTDYPYSENAVANFVSVKLDGTEVEVGDAFLSAEGTNGGLRLTLTNLWNGDITTQPMDAASLPEFQTIEIKFKVDGAPGYKAQLGAQLDSTFNATVGEWPDLSGSAATIEVGKEATVTYTFDSEVKFAGNYVAVDTNLPYAADAVAKFVSVKVDGTDVTVGDPFLSAEGTDGGLRLTLTNLWNGDITTQPMDASAVPAFKTIEIKFIVESLGTVGGGEDAGDSSDESAFDPAGKYNAYFGLQSPSWTYRDPWNADNGIGSENWGQWVKNNDTGETYGVVTDAEVAGNGTYTVSLKEIGDVFKNEFANNADGLDKFRILMVTTNIPLSDDVKITDVKLIMDGKTIKTYDEAFLDPDDKEYCKILLQNEWNADLKETLPFYNAPTESIELQFTIEGFNYDNENAKPDEPETTTKAPAADTNNGDNKDGGLDPIVIVVIVVAVVAVVAGAVVVLGKKKKTNN